MRTRAIHMIGLLFGLSLVLAACDAEDLLALLDGSVADQGPVAEAASGGDVARAADRAGNAGDEASADEASADDAIAHGSDAAEGKSEDREFQCRRAGIEEAEEAAAEGAGEEGAAHDGGDAPAGTRADGDGTKDSDDAAAGRDAAAGDDAAAGRDAAPGRDAAAAGSDDAPARKPRRAPAAPVPSAGSSGGPSDGSSSNLSAMERDIFDRLTTNRGKAGLKALTLSAEISRGARSWSCDMAASGDFRHADLRAAGVYGENIAWGQRSAAEVHRGWMTSSGHRDNRMYSRWTEYGVGVCENSGGHLYFTERFR